MRISDTINFIQKAHKGQTDKGGHPYWLHPISVMRRLPEGMDLETKIAALLHDVLEDTQYTESDLRALGYTEEVIDTVKLLTRDKSDGKTYIEWVQSIADSGNVRAIRIKLADNEDNSDPKRIAQLPESERSIVKRYQRSMKILRVALEKSCECPKKD